MGQRLALGLIIGGTAFSAFYVLVSLLIIDGRRRCIEAGIDSPASCIPFPSIQLLLAGVAATFAIGGAFLLWRAGRESNRSRMSR